MLGMFTLFSHGGFGNVRELIILEPYPEYGSFLKTLRDYLSLEKLTMLYLRSREPSSVLFEGAETSEDSDDIDSLAHYDEGEEYEPTSLLEFLGDVGFSLTHLGMSLKFEDQWV